VPTLNIREEEMKHILLFVMISGLMFSAVGRAEDIPKLISYQGMLTDEGGNPLNETVNMTFKIYVDSLSTSPSDRRWEETQTGIEVTDGLFSLNLGEVIPLELDFSEDYWLDVTVGAEHIPDRVRISSVGYTYRASMADSALVTGGDADWVISGDDMYSAPSGNVGIGTTSPGVKLNIDGGSDVAAGVENSGYLILGTPTAHHIAVDNNEIMAKSDGTHGDILHVSKSATGTYLGSPVGIGTPPPASGSDLDVVGDVRVRGADIKDAGGTSRITLADGGRLDLKKYDGSEVLSIDTLGNVGIGAVSPDEKLEVDGNINVSGKVTYGSPHTHYLSLGPSAFRPSENENYWSSEEGVFTDHGGAPWLVAPVNLPHGAVVTEFTVFYYDDDVEFLEVRLQRMNLSTRTYQTLAMTQSPYSATGWGSDTDSGISYATVDNTTYSYCIRDSGYSKPYLRIVQAVIAYTIDEMP
jgi:hypothetical protein